MAKYLVTGGAGFIGSNIVEELVKRKAKVRVLDSLITGNIKNLKPFISKIDFIKGDIRDKKAAMKATKGVDYVIHQAALRSVAKSVDDPFTTNDINISGTLNMLAAARDNNPQKASSGSQFYINHSDNSFLDGQYTVFGVVDSGMDIVEQIAAVKTDPNDNPVVPVTITTIVPAVKS